MNWKLIEYDTFSGKYNMEYDLQLVKKVSQNSPILRFYGWKPFCISIGANQSYHEINTFLADKNHIDIVKRPTGGRAILHAEELTYSVIMPNCNEISGRKLYEAISLSIVFGLKKYNSKLDKVKLENGNPDFANLLKEESGSLCFASTAKSEIKFDGKKLVGSAQRKLGSTILQHGSILIGNYHKDLVNYLNVNEDAKLNLKNEIEERTIEICSIIDTDVKINDLQETIISGFENVLNAKFSKNNIELLAQS